MDEFKFWHGYSKEQIINKINKVLTQNILLKLTHPKLWSCDAVVSEVNQSATTNVADGFKFWGKKYAGSCQQLKLTHFYPENAKY